MIEKFRYFLFFAFLAFFNLKGFSQAVGTPYFAPNGRGTSLTFVKFPYTGRDTTRIVSTEIYVDAFCVQGATISSLGGAAARVYCKLPLAPGTIFYSTVGGQSTNNIAVNGYGYSYINATSLVFSGALNMGKVNTSCYIKIAI